MARSFAPRNVGREAWRHRVKRPDGVVALASGGLDSCALIGRLAGQGREVFPLFVKGGLVWEQAELSSLRRFLAALPAPLAAKVRSLRVSRSPVGDLYGSHWSVTGRRVPGWRAADNSVYLPGRNILLLGQAAVYAALLGVRTLAMGTLAGNPFPDASRRFLGAMAKSLSAGLDFPIKIEAPFLGIHKEDVIRSSADLPLHLTFSCSNPVGRAACRACAKCRERILALKAAGLPFEQTRILKKGLSR